MYNPENVDTERELLNKIILNNPERLIEYLNLYINDLRYANDTASGNEIIHNQGAISFCKDFVDRIKQSTPRY